MSNSLYELTGQALLLMEMALEGEVDEQTFAAEIARFNSRKHWKTTRIN